MEQQFAMVSCSDDYDVDDTIVSEIETWKMRDIAIPLSSS